MGVSLLVGTHSESGLARRVAFFSRILGRFKIADALRWQFFVSVSRPEFV